MSTRQRIGFAVLAAVVAAVAIVLLRPDESSERADDPGERSGQSADVQSDGGERAGGGRAPAVARQRNPRRPSRPHRRSSGSPSRAEQSTGAPRT